MKVFNEHEELKTKFENLQSALEITLIENQKMKGGQAGTHSSRLQSLVTDEIRHTQLHYHSQIDLTNDLEKNISAIFDFYHGRMILMDKIETQNRKLK